MEYVGGVDPILRPSYYSLPASPLETWTQQNRAASSDSSCLVGWMGMSRQACVEPVGITACFDDRFLSFRLFFPCSRLGFPWLMAHSSLITILSVQRHWRVRRFSSLPTFFSQETHCCSPTYLCKYCNLYLPLDDSKQP